MGEVTTVAEGLADEATVVELLVAEVGEDTTTTRTNIKRKGFPSQSVEVAILPTKRTAFTYTTAAPSSEEPDRGRYR